MPNAFAIKPELDSVFPKPVRLWTCPLTGLSVPKDPSANLQWRANMLAEAEKDHDLRTDLYTASQQSILFWINAFVFTLRVFEPSADGSVQQAEHTHLPFVTWEIQDTHILRLEQCIEEGESLLTDKSRDMGATWDHIAAYAHRFLFHGDETHLMISRKEDAVDVLDGQPRNYPHGSLADPGTLFGKIDYILSRLPEWMLPRMTRKKMHLVNLDNRCRVDGESSNATAGSSDRRTSIFLDEMAKMDEAESIKRSTKDVTACRLPCSTPNGAGTTYSKWRNSGQIPVFILPWWEHPEKGKDRYVDQDKLGRWKIRSPWYDRRCAEDSPKEIAIELDMDHVGSGDTFFESVVIEQHKKMFCKPPLKKTGVAFKKELAEDKIALALQKWDTNAFRMQPGQMHLWVDLVGKRPDQTKTYTIGCDIGKGQSASNSVAAIMCNETREIILEYADAEVAPHQFAKTVCALGLWCGGRNKRPLVIWENNGDPGFDFGKQLVHVYNYPNIYFDRQAGTIGEKRGKRYGWRSSPEKKAAGLGALRRAYAVGRIINHSEIALAETLTYITYEGGGIGPAELVEESDSARKAHGDRVIANMLCVIAQTEAPRYKRAEGDFPHRSIGSRLKQFQRRKKDAELPNRRFNFAGAA